MMDDQKSIHITNDAAHISLPDWCYTVLPYSGALIVVKRGISGYGQLRNSTNDPQKNRELAREYNAQMGVTPQQEAAMLGGSMFGWDTPVARLTSYNEKGEPIPPSRQTRTVQETTESRFLNHSSDGFAIYQLKQTEETLDLRFEPLVRLQLNGMTIDRANYECVYTAPLPADAPKAPHDSLNALYEQFNMDCPADFRGHSLSVSDVVALKQGGQLTCHYVDRWGFAELPGFFQPENPLKNAEMAMEDDYGMIDGVINNGKAQDVKEQDKLSAPMKEKPSVLAQLKAKPVQQQPARRPPTKETGLER